MTLTGNPARLLLLAVALFSGSPASMAQQEPNQPPSAPVITTRPALHGAVLVSITATTPGSTITYTLDSSKPTPASPRYEAPFLVARSLTLQAIAWSQGSQPGKMASQSFAIHVAPGTLVWSDEFDPHSSSPAGQAQPDPDRWTYDTGSDGFGNHELETYCAWGESTHGCSPTEPNAYLGSDGSLHVVARKSATGSYTSARLKSQGLFSFQYGRLEVRAKLPEAQGLWPAIWLMGNSIASVNWPACGEMDMVERVNAAASPDWNEGSIHGTGFTGAALGTQTFFPKGQSAAEWHTYGMLWSPGKVAYYLDDPAKPYVTYTRDSLATHPGAVWPFDNGQASFLILNLAVGGDWPGRPDATTQFPAEMLVDYVRVYAE